VARQPRRSKGSPFRFYLIFCPERHWEAITDTAPDVQAAIQQHSEFRDIEKHTILGSNKTSGKVILSDLVEEGYSTACDRAFP
jgi:hypothetical protein